MRPSHLVNLPRRCARYLSHLWRDVRPAAKRRRVSMSRIVREEIVLKRRNLLMPDEYFLFGLDDPSIPWEEKLAYIGGALHRKHWYLMTPQGYHCFFKNKLVFKHLFGSMGFPVAKLYGVYDPSWGHTVDGAPLRTAGDIATWMSACDVQDPVFKPMESAEGRMVFVMRGRKPGDATKFVSLSGEEFSPEKLVRTFSDPALLREAYPYPEYKVPLRTMLVEQRLHQHAALRIFAPDTLCCTRIVTLTTLDGRVEILETAMKLQRESKGVDNVTQGSVSIAVEPETGMLGTGWCKHDSGDIRRRCLPGTDIEFTGFQLPMWQEALDLARSAAAAFPHAHTVGWDIAFTVDGPFIVEGNAAWGDFQLECGEGLYKGSYREVLKGLRQRAQSAAAHPGGPSFFARRLVRKPGLINPFKAVRFLSEVLTRGRRVARENHLKLSRIVREQVALYKSRHLHRKEYYWYELYDPRLTWEEKAAYIGGRAVGRYWRTFSPEKYWALIRYKPVFNSYCQACGIRTAQRYGIFEPIHGRTADDKPLRNADDIRRWLISSGVTEFVLKPAYSSQGTMILVLRHHDEDPPDVLTDLSGRRYTAGDLVRHMTDESLLREAYPPPRVMLYDFLIERRLRPHPEVVRLTGSDTTCSVRVLTVLTREGVPEIVAALFKHQPHNVGVDNASKGAMTVAVNVQDGTLGEGCFMYLSDYRASPRYRRHPDGGTEFYGRRLPLWDQLVDVAKKAALAFPMMRCVGWDIAITPDGPAILEGNVRWGVESLQLSGRRGLVQGVFRETYEYLESGSGR